MQGFVGQRSFTVKAPTSDATSTENSERPKSATLVDASSESTDGLDSSRSFLLTLVSRRSVKRSGLRYLRRGIDDEGNCANNVESEQILSSQTWDQSIDISSFTQVRASIPLYFSQSPYTFKPAPTLHQSFDVNRKAVERHFDQLRQRYGLVQVVMLVDKRGGEQRIGEEYERHVEALKKVGGSDPPRFEWFDFHAECRGMKFENVQILFDKLESTIKEFGETVVSDQTVKKKQTGVIRTNCMDCLDRTNVVQSAIAQYMLQKNLERRGFEIDFAHDPNTQWFNTLWADNGDAISRQYASTAALKGDYTRTRKRDYRGTLNDWGLSLTRYYINIINDYFSQTVIDLLLGNVTSRDFDDFEATMMSSDPGISIEKIRENAIDTCSKIVVQDRDEELVHGWAMLAPAHTNTLRTLPLEEAVLLLTDRAIYGCKFEWSMEKVASFERIELGSVSRIHYGTYVTSTLSEGQMDEELNIGLVITYAPGHASIKRVNTRSLQVATDDDPDARKAHTEYEASVKRQRENNPASIWSWLNSRRSDVTRHQFMAMKVIPHRSLLADERRSSNIACTGPRETAEQICDEIQHVIRDAGKADPDAKEETEGEDENMVREEPIISAAEARSRTGYLEQIGHSIKKFVWA
jgi:hypothetical protein